MVVTLMSRFSLAIVVIQTWNPYLSFSMLLYVQHLLYTYLSPRLISARVCGTRMIRRKIWNKLLRCLLVSLYCIHFYVVFPKLSVYVPQVTFKVYLSGSRDSCQNSPFVCMDLCAVAFSLSCTLALAGTFGGNCRG